MGEINNLIYMLLGACIGFFLKEISRYFQMNISYNFKQHEEYAQRTQEIIDALANIISLHIRLNANQLIENNIKQCKKTISDLYFKHYNYLPQEVLNALNCLFLCLSSNGKYMYAIEYMRTTTLDRLKHRIGFKRCKYVEFKQCEDCSEFMTEDFQKMILDSNALHKIEKVLKMSRQGYNIPVGMKLNLQARYVIYVIHKYYQKPYLKTWDTYLLKHDIFKQK